MIEIIEGRGVGAGKSYYACMRIISHIAAGGTVYASDTFGLKWDETAALIRTRFGVEVEADQYACFPEGDIKRLHEVTPPGTEELPVLVVVDECHGELNARDWNDASKKAFFKWLTQSRHDDTDVIFISQSAHNIDKQIARLVTYISRVRNMRNFKFPGLGRWPLRQFVVNQFDQDGKVLMDRKWYWHDKGIFDCYKSKVMRGAHTRLANTGVPKKKLQKTNVASMSTMAKFLIIAVVILLLVGIWKGCEFQERRKANSATPAPTTGTARTTPEPIEPKLRTGKREVKLREGELLAYDVIQEAFRSQSGPWDLTTEAGEYTVGRMSVRGLVVGIESRVVRIVQPDGRIAYVVADARTLQVPSMAAPVATPAPAATPTPQEVAETGKGPRLVGGTVRNGKLIPYFAPEYENEAQRAMAGEKAIDTKENKR